MSKLRVSAIHDPFNNNEALTIDTSGNVGITNALTMSTLTVTNGLSVGSLSVGGATINSTGAAEVVYLDGVTSNVQTQLDGKQSTLVAGTDYLTPTGDGSSLTGINTDLVSDTTPQLGGDLDLNSNDITGTGNIDITGTVTADGLLISQGNPAITITDTDGSTSTTLKTVGSNTELSNPTGGNLRFRTNASELERMRISPDGDISFYDSTGSNANFFWDASTEQLFIGSTSGGGQLHVDATLQTSLQLEHDTNGTKFAVDHPSGGSVDLQTYTGGAWTTPMSFKSGNVGIGTSSPVADLEIKRTGAVNVKLQVTSAYESALSLVNGGGSEVSVINAGGSNVMSLRTNNTERMRIDSSGRLILGGASSASPADTSLFEIENDGTQYAQLIYNPGTGVQGCIRFHNPNGTVGSIYTNGSSTSYNTSSDYRLKENVVDMTGAIDRVKALQPKRFNFIADEDDTTVDGFLAHEVSDVIPEAISGTHNEVDDDNNPVYQGIDQSKLVPLLTGALQEAIAKIEELETRIETLENP